MLVLFDSYAYTLLMRKTFKYRLYPTRRQATMMRQCLSECCWLYNQFLEQRKILWEENQESINLYGQQAFLPKLKAKRPNLKQAHSQILQNVGVRVDLAFKAFFRRAKRGDKPGYPRFKSWKRYNSFTYPQDIGFSIIEDKSLVRLGKIGRVKLKYHRPIEGRATTATIKHTSTGKWFITFSCEVEPKALEPSTSAIGIDVGLESFLTAHDGRKVENPRFFRKEEKALAKAQRKLSTAEKGSSDYQQRRLVVARVHERIGNKRRDFCHQLSRQLVDEYGLIAVEDLSINKMVKKNKDKNMKGLNKSIGDAGWRMFVDLLDYKAEEAGRTLVKVNPAFTSQTCSACGYRTAKKLSDRVHKCSSCGFEMDRDQNAAINILTLGLQGQDGYAVQEAAGSLASAERPLFLLFGLDRQCSLT